MERELCSAYDAAGVLGLERASVLRLYEAGLCGELYRSGERLYALRERVEEVAAWPEPAPMRALVVRVKPAIREPHVPKLRRWQGWSASDELTDEDRRLGVAGFWAVADPDAWHGDLFIATIAGVIAHFGIITGHTVHAGGLGFFHLEDPSDEVAQTLSEHRFHHPVRGGNIVRLEGPARLRH